MHSSIKYSEVYDIHVYRDRDDNVKADVYYNNYVLFFFEYESTHTFIRTAAVTGPFSDPVWLSTATNERPAIGMVRLLNECTEKTLS